MRMLLSPALAAFALALSAAAISDTSEVPAPDTKMTVAALPAMTRRVDTPPATLIPVAGAECPSGSGAYCGDELPYCCPGVSVPAYCAVDVNGCTK